MKKYVMYGNYEEKFFDNVDDYYFTLFIGSADELRHEVEHGELKAGEMQYEDDYEYHFKMEWLNDRCDRYAIVVDYLDDFTGDRLKYPRVCLLSQIVRRAYERIIEARNIPENTAIRVDGFFDDDNHQRLEVLEAPLSSYGQEEY